ncbi:MAG: hypothetical protein PHN72_01585 [Bacilli bacterium]|nr:hypothetical protein [Bacilli bacterium]
MREDIIKNSVYFLKLNEIDYYIKQNTTFKSIFDNTDKEKLIEIYYRNKQNSNVFNGVSTRLDKIILNKQNCILEISKVNYFDLITSNMLYFKPNQWLDNCLSEDELNFCKNKIGEIRGVIEGHKKLEDIINNENISNIMAVSVLIEDMDGKIGITKRTSNVSMSSGFVSTSVTGSVDGENYLDDNPLIHCVNKEVFEELGLKINQIELKGLAISKTKLQPIFLFNAKLDDTWENVIQKMKSAKDYKKEIEKFSIVSISDIPGLLTNNELSDATRYHIYLKYKGNNK